MEQGITNIDENYAGRIPLSSDESDEEPVKISLDKKF
jgi:hypothetical protein